MPLRSLLRVVRFISWALLFLGLVWLARLDKSTPPAPAGVQKAPPTYSYNDGCCTAPGGTYAGYGQLVRYELGYLEYVSPAFKLPRPQPASLTLIATSDQTSE